MLLNRQRAGGGMRAVPRATLCALVHDLSFSMGQSVRKYVLSCNSVSVRLSCRVIFEQAARALRAFERVALCALVDNSALS